MNDAAAPRSTRRTVDEAALRRVRRRLAAAAEPPWLHAEIARRMAERLAILRTPPRTVIDWYAADGASTAVLQAACPGATTLRIAPDEDTSIAEPPPWWSPRRWRGVSPLQPASALVPGAADLLWANMGLHWCADPVVEMQRWQPALAVDGFLMFSTLGPGSLTGLRALYAAMGWPAPHAPFVDMHDLGDMLVQAGFADPVMDQETVTLTWADGAALLAELRSLGGNADPARHAGLRTPRWRDTLAQALCTTPGERPALAFEVVYGHAVRPRPRPRLAPETRVDLHDMRSILRR
jgi:malonyl-CoA O-methyltransferase